MGRRLGFFDYAGSVKSRRAWVKTASASTAERINQKTRISAINSAAGNVKPNQPTMSARDFSTLWE